MVHVVGSPVGTMVAVLAFSLGRVGGKGWIGGRLLAARAVPRSDVDGLALVEVLISTPPGGIGEHLSESSVLFGIGVACGCRHLYLLCQCSR